MRIGVPKEMKVHEYRVALVPAGARSLIEAKHEVMVQAGAGQGSGLKDAEYEAAGASVVPEARTLFDACDLILKVKDPTADEAAMLRPGQILFCYLHLAAAPEVTRTLLEREVTAVAYETVQLPDGSLPLLAPMSEVAGRLAVQVGLHFLQREHGGRGILLGGVPGVPRGKVTVIGAGTVGINAVRVAHALGAEVDVLDISLPRLTYLYDIFSGNLGTLVSNSANVERSVLDADLVIGAVLIPGGRAPRLVTRNLVKRMKPGTVMVDVSVDQGGCIETIHPTTHADPVYTVDGVIHYGVTNMPGAVPRTSTFALTNTTLPYVQKLAAAPIAEVAAEDPSLRRGINLHAGRVTHPGVAEAQGLPLVEPPGGETA
ncbi:MAG: alanine dehydrogenase [Deltaproteobacteria bacterium]|nr:alanine dehydrogenase [Deltaproteobacteria bacterium]